LAVDWRRYKKFHLYTCDRVSHLIRESYPSPREGQILPNFRMKMEHLHRTFGMKLILWFSYIQFHVS
ncbi:hypothetical protein MKX03_009489, partial [Papaver bracteatum]